MKKITSLLLAHLLAVACVLTTTANTDSPDTSALTPDQMSQDSSAGLTDANGNPTDPSAAATVAQIENDDKSFIDDGSMQDDQSQNDDSTTPDSTPANS